MKFWSVVVLLGTLTVVGAVRAASKVKINSDNVLEIDGQKVFVISFQRPPLPHQLTPDGRNGIDELRDAGATFIRASVIDPDPRWDDAGFKLVQDWFDAAQRNGMHVVLTLRLADMLDEDDPGKKQLMERIITRFKDHPALGVYAGVDEPEWVKVPVAPMVRAYEYIKQLDPGHPVWVNQAPRGTVEAMRAYDGAYDITGTDVYPISYPPGIHSLESNKSMSMVGDFTRRMVEVSRGRKPVWTYLQIAWSGVTKPGQTLRFPTFAEQRFMTYETIINGARGIVFFGGHIPSAMTPRDTALGWNWHFWQRVLRPLIEEIGEKSRLYPALVAPDSKLPVHATAATTGPAASTQALRSGKGEDQVEVLVRETESDLYVLACKREGQTIKVRFEGLPEGMETGQVLYEEPRTVSARRGVFTDWFAPFEVHVYRFAKRR